uniref:Protein phosphatase n=1 Tax=Eutreptiella gymnastica TaxID=73025 RepID=A0A7S1JCH3_9EUGL|mmetsp:Transcript_8465/g.15165  ORF Transcript_8465/g.15165 Transcript_8465/m.15165 type:complete len:223 (+) Transcript_8465:86-754(+)
MFSRLLRSPVIKGSILQVRGRVFSSEPVIKYQLKCSVGFLPHPLKKPYGEDAYFICEESGAVGVADGSSTVCIAILNGDVVDVCNLGDSGFMLVRNGEIVHMSKEQTHGFNYPFQLGVESMDTPIDADLTQHTVTEGDILVLATDGVFDNLFQEQILELLQNAKEDDISTLGPRLADLASDMASDRTWTSPYALKCHSMLGIAHSGGKMDDITAVVGRICAI